jgi:DNA ligase D-like protein (predicted polymerase)
MPEEERYGVRLTNLDQPLSDDAGATKRDLVDYLDAMADRLVPVLTGRALSVVRVRLGQAPFMQKNLPKYAPEWIARTAMWAEASHRTVSYALCNDRRTLLWFANQRAIEYHPTLVTAGRLDHVTHLVLDLDPPEGTPLAPVVATAHLVGEALGASGLQGAVKTSGAKGLHIVVPIDASVAIDDAAAATRAIARRAEQLDPALATTAFLKADRAGKVFVDSTRAGGATVVAAYSPRVRPGVSVSYPVAWDELDEIDPREFTIRRVPGLLGDADPWRDRLPPPQRLPADLVAEGHGIPVARVAAMHEGKRRARRAARAD